jgi:hypothetical protein
VIRGRSSQHVRAAVLLVLLPCLPATVGCARAVDGVPTGVTGDAVPESADELGALVVTEVPSGLEHYGYRQGWERFWGSGSGGPMTGVFVDQFSSRAGAVAYAEDLARNDAEHYDGVLHDNPPDLPGGCRMLTVDDAEAQAALGGPAALAWCGHGPFSVAVTAVAASMDAAREEVLAVVDEQLDRLPP